MNNKVNMIPLTSEESLISPSLSFTHMPDIPIQPPLNCPLPMATSLPINTLDAEKVPNYAQRVQSKREKGEQSIHIY